VSANSDFLDRLASQLKIDKNAACCRAIERILAMMKKSYEGGKCSAQTEAELDFRRFVEEQGTCRKPKAAVKTIPHKGSRGK
jgi:hypothetical protein